MTAPKLLFSPSVEVVDDGQGDVLFYVNERLSHRLSGKSVGVLTEHLLPLLDGSRTRDEVYAALGSRLSEAAMDALLGKLSQLRLLRRVHSTGLSGGVPSFVADASDDPEGDWRRVRAHPIALVGPASPSVSVWISALRDAGFESVRWVAQPSEEDADALLASGFVIAVEEDENRLRPLLFELNRAALAAKRSWLIVRFTRAEEAWIGPLFEEGEACYQCLVDRWRANLKTVRETERFIRWQRETAPGKGPGTYPPHATQIAAVVAYEAVRWIAGFEASPLASAVRIVDLRSQECTTHRVLRHPMCAACGRADIARPTPWEEDALRVEAFPAK